MAWEIFERESGRYEQWYDTAHGRRVDRAERALLAWLLGRFSGARRVLEVGCGTGHFTRWLMDRGLSPVGLDRSPAMLGEARRADFTGPLVLADAHRLPVRNGAVDLALLVTTLEFLDVPAVALAESVRVAGRGVVVVVLNRWSPGGVSRRLGDRAASPLLASANDYTLGGLDEALRRAAAHRLRGLHWRSTLLPRPFDGLVSRLPFGNVLGMAAELAPR
jgi:ubiquinone/menaquinone biosynthesis C-methylase UbiE